MSVGEMGLIALGASGGAILRWQLSNWFNPLCETANLGTLFANLGGCFLIGMAMAYAVNMPMKLLFMTGFLGSFTTFSAFSAEIVTQLLQGRYWQGGVILLLHIVGGLFATLIGFWLVKTE